MTTHPATSTAIRFVTENLVDGTLTIHAEWDAAWAGHAEGDVLVHEATMFDPSTFSSQYAPGTRMYQGTKNRIAAFVADELARRELAATIAAAKPTAAAAQDVFIARDGSEYTIEVAPSTPKTRRTRSVRCKVCKTLYTKAEGCYHCRHLAEDQATIDRINSVPHMFPVRAGLLPSGQRILRAYHGVPGIWCTTEDGRSWCGVHDAIPVPTAALDGDRR